MNTDLIQAHEVIAQLRLQIRDLEHDLVMQAPRQLIALGNSKRAVMYNGIEYPSVQAAADAHGITRQAMSKRLRKEGN